jgi:hypothetical protein
MYRRQPPFLVFTYVSLDRLRERVPPQERPPILEHGVPSMACCPVVALPSTGPSLFLFPTRICSRTSRCIHYTLSSMLWLALAAQAQALGRVRLTVRLTTTNKRYPRTRSRFSIILLCICSILLSTDFPHTPISINTLALNMFTFMQFAAAKLAPRSSPSGVVPLEFEDPRQLYDLEFYEELPVCLGAVKPQNRTVFAHIRTAGLRVLGRFHLISIRSGKFH